MSRKCRLNWLAAEKLLLLLVIALATTSCFWGDEFETRHLIGDYYLDGVELEPDSWYLYHQDEEGNLGEALLNKHIAEVGFNRKCIVLRVVGPAPSYYIMLVDDAAARQSREFARSTIVGPLNKAEFQTAVRRLNNGKLLPFAPELTSF